MSEAKPHIAKIETVPVGGDTPDQSRHNFVFCRVFDGQHFRVAHLIWEPSDLRDGDDTPLDIEISVDPESEDAINRPDMGCEESFVTLETNLDSCKGLAPSHAGPVIEDHLLAAVAVWLNPGCEALVSKVMAHESLKAQGRAGTDDSRERLSTIKHTLAGKGLEYDTITLASLGARKAIRYIDGGLVEGAGVRAETQ